MCVRLFKIALIKIIGVFFRNNFVDYDRFNIFITIIIIYDDDER